MASASASKTSSRTDIIQCYHLPYTKKTYAQSKKNKTLLHHQVWLLTSPNKSVLKKYNTEEWHGADSEYGLTPCIIAAIKGNIAALRIFAELPSQLVTPDAQGFNILHHAAICGHYDEVREVLTEKQAGELESQRNRLNMTPLVLRDIFIPSPVATVYLKQGDEYTELDSASRKEILGRVAIVDRNCSSRKSIVEIWNQNKPLIEDCEFIGTASDVYIANEQVAVERHPVLGLQLVARELMNLSK